VPDSAPPDTRAALCDRLARPGDLAQALDPILTELARLVRAGLTKDDTQLITTKQLAELLAISVPTLERMRASGRLLEPVELSRGCLRYRLGEVRDWVAVGCPPRREWQARCRKGGRS